MHCDSPQLEVLGDIGSRHSAITHADVQFTEVVYIVCLWSKLGFRGASHSPWWRCPHSMVDERVKKCMTSEIAQIGHCQLEW
uniref:Uncharacterized protein n=1 Tax=Hordeum vulgare subsp. vulgare TaxID=112509 RepID=A0A8I6X4T2_HORVV